MRRLGYFMGCLLLGQASALLAQRLEPVPTRMVWVKNKGGTVCQSSGRNVPSYIAPPDVYLNRLKNPGARTQNLATFHVDYQGFSPEAQTAFQNAVDIWSSLLQSPVTINVLAIWTPLSSSTPGFETLGSASPISFYANFDGALKTGVYYPTALAEKMAGKNLNESVLDPNTGAGYEIVANFNSTANWDYSLNSVGFGKVHLTTVVLHELGHGLGVYDTYDVASNAGSYGLFDSTFPDLYDVFVESNSGRILNLANNSATMATSLTGGDGNVTYNSALATANNSNTKVRLYAPSTWQSGSSVAHLDQNTYSGTVNELMRPQLDNQQVTLDPGPIIQNMFKDMGWVVPYIVHTPLKNTETVNSSFDVTATITPDGSSGYSIIASSVTLNYSINGGAIVQVPMTPGSADTFTAQLPVPPVVPANYAYFISVNDNLNRTLTKPGQIVKPGQGDVQASFQFTAGPDTKAPHITHIPVSFIKNTDTQLAVTAVLTDNIGVQGAVVQYQINGVDQADATMVNTSDSTYTATISVSVADGDIIKYRIKATDSSVEQNIGYAPTSTTFYTVKVVGLGPTQDSYSNNFNAPTNDFFGDNLFSITTPAGFADGAINTSHPYPESNPVDSISYVYELRIPIKLKGSGGATLVFDEIVLCEPGANGSTWPSSDFFDYVIVEGSKDGGSTWKKLINGYDCRDQSDWLTKWNSLVNATTGNSSAVGDPTLFKTRSIDMTTTGYFKKGDVIVIRFRLMSDQLAAGWGWAIDNLKIQIDDTPPVILHNHLDFIASTTSSFDITTNVTDFGGVKDIALQYSINNGTPTVLPISPILPNNSQYTWTLVTNGVVNAGDEIEYKLMATDSVGNAGSLPATGSFKVAVLNLKSPVTSYTSDFNTANTDFVGNYFSIGTPAGFNDGAIQSAHPYPNGFGLNNASNFCYMLKNPVIINAVNSKMLFSEIVIAETVLGGVKDYVIVEGSKNQGVTWLPFVNSYSSNVLNLWQAAYGAKQDGNPSLFNSRLIDLTQKGNFHAGDTVLIRFRLFADKTTNAWGWAIDNLSIQGPVTGIEDLSSASFSVYPNPVSADYFNVIVPQGSSRSNLTLTDMLGRQVLETVLDAPGQDQKVFVGELPGGIYIAKVSAGQGQWTKKIIIKR